MLTCQKDAFSLPPELHYLNCAYMSPLLRRVEAAGIDGIRRKRVPSRLQPADFFEESDRLRRAFAGLVNIPDPHDVALVPAVSYAVAVVARNVRWARGQNVVVADEQFPSNVYTWRRLEQEGQATVRTVRPPEDGGARGRRWNERLLEAIDAATAVVALGSVDWADGTRFDLEAIGRRAREVGALLVVDGTQSVGALPFDVQQVQPDVLVCAGYKWLLGPYSLGLAYFGPRFRDGIPLEEHWINRLHSENFSGLVEYEDAYQPGALRYDVGERSNFILVPMLLAGIEQVRAWGVDAIQDYCRRLTTDLLADARALGYAVEDEAWRGAHLFGLRAAPHVSMDHLRAALAERRVSVSVRGTALRIAPHVYNDAADVDALREVLHDVVTRS